MSARPLVPADLSMLDIAFPGDVTNLLPPWTEIPREFKSLGSSNRWVRAAEDWFHGGLEHAEWEPKPGVDGKAALRHILVCIRSYQPQHEHKIAGCAYLLSLWFDEVKYEGAPRG